MTPAEMLEVLEAAEETLSNLDICDSPTCRCPECPHALLRVREAIKKLKAGG